MNTPAIVAPATPDNARSHGRKTVTIAVTATVLSLAFGALWFFTHERGEEVTEDAYVEGNIVQVTAQVAGTVVAIGADNTDRVVAGQQLVTLNDLDAQLALERSQAQLAKTVRQVRSQFALAAQMSANVQLRRSELSKVQADFARRRNLVNSGAISGEDLEHATESVKTASAALQSAQQQLVGNQAAVDGTTIATHPDVLGASAQLKDAYIARARSIIAAPVAGLVARRNVQVGQRVAAGTSLMSIIPLETLWVTANFKESQLRHVHSGQAVTMIADAYGGDVIYHGIVVGQEAGTGSAFSLMPAQNATGNWIKVVQRLPVRIGLDPKEVAAHPLQLGLSMRVEVDTSVPQNAHSATAPNAMHAYHTDVFAREGGDAVMSVKRIISANAGTGLAAP